MSSGDPRPDPPRWSRAVLRALLPSRDRGVVPAELGELYRERIRARGGRRARWWYRRQVARFARGLVGYRIRRFIASLTDSRLYREPLSMDGILRDVRLAGRLLARRPGFTVVAILSLALGIGANTAIFSVVNAVLLRGLPVEDPDQLVEVYTSDAGGMEHATFSYPDFRDLQEENEVFRGVVGYEVIFGVTERDGRSELVLGEIVSANYFDVLGVDPVLGRGFRPDEDEVPGRDPVTVLSWETWQDRFGGDPDVLGRTFHINQLPFTVVGVAPQEFDGLLPAMVPEVWVPLAMVNTVKPSDSNRLESRGSRSMFVKARLLPDVTPEQAEIWVEAFAARLAEAYPESNENRTMTVLPSSSVSVHPAVDGALTPVAGLLLGVVGLVLLIACTNLASFLLARAEDRRRDIAVRLAMGAGRVALVRQLMVETVMLAGMGAVGGVFLARWTLDALMGFQPPIPIPVSLDVSLDGTVLLFTLGVAVAAGIGLGLIPALRTTNPDLAATLKDGAAPEGTGRRRLNVRNALVVAQVTLSLVLLVGAGLFIRSLQQASSIDPGFDTGPAAILWPDMELSGLDEEEGRATYRMLEERLLAHPAIDEVTRADALPLGISFQSNRLRIPGMESARPDGLFPVDHARVDGSYFETMDVPIRRGRTFRPADAESGDRVAVVSEAFVRRFFPDGDAVGRTVEDGGGNPIRIVGVAADTKVRTLGEDFRPRIYFPIDRIYLSSSNIVVRGSGSSSELLGIARRVARDVNPELVFFETKTMEEHLSLMLFAPRMAALLLGVFGGLGLLLAAVGIYGVVSYAVARRTREMGIRLSVGASPRNVMAMMVRGGMGLVAAGALLGLALAAAMGSLVSGYLFGIEWYDPFTFAAIPAVLGAVALLAAWIPARRASSVDPSEALRSE